MRCSAFPEVIYFGTCACGILHVAVVQLPLSQKKEVIGLSSAPGIIQHVNIRTDGVFLKQPSECVCCLFTNKKVNADVMPSHTHTHM